MSTELPPASRRWLPRFSLRALLIAIGILCLLTGFAANWYRSARTEHRRQLAIAEQLKQCGVEVSWTDKTPACVNWVGGIEACQRVTGVTLLVTSKGEKAMDLFDELPTVESIYFVSESHANNRAIDRVAKLKHVRFVRVNMLSLLKATNADDARTLIIKCDKRTNEIRERLPDVEVDWWSMSN